MAYYGGTLTGADKKQYAHGTPEYQRLAAEKDAAAAKPVAGPVAPTAPGAPTPTHGSPAQPTFQPPVDPRIAQLQQSLAQPMANVGSGFDGQIGQLQKQLQEQLQQLQGASSSSGSAALQQLSSPINIARPDTSRLANQSQQLQGQISQMLSGRGPQIGSVANDPEAVAYRLAAQRSAEQSRQEEADRLGASGQSGSGEFDSRLAQIREATGSDVAQFEGGLSGRRRGEAMQSQLQGANLSLQDLQRQQQQEQAKFESELALEDRRRQGVLSSAQMQASQTANQGQDLQRLYESLIGQQAGARDSAMARSQMERQNQQQLLHTLLGQQTQQQGAAERQAEVTRQAEQQRLQEELLRQQVLAGQQAQTSAGARRGGGFSR